MDPGPFENALAVLSRAEVRYLVVGGVAFALNGFVRTTEDDAGSRHTVHARGWNSRPRSR